MKGNMQLFSVEQHRSQALEAHAASFATFKVQTFLLTYFFVASHLDIKMMSLFVDYFVLTQVPGNDQPCILIAFTTKSFNAGQIISKLHVIELGSHPG